ncbi:hypothetical protein GcC1_182052 [Golovinomyces cichoracearum]|uniref:Uncharacterized protein n=1 Tax=Golovinomyces cichoracearum TaxID=62708 RepID=A0A420HM98_9PEZI|nr:hypothetical protein GcC1_182052 [Golovinomyces cichoracearum]
MSNNIRIEDVEILVHISTPSFGASSDAHWRSCAESYVNFISISQRKLKMEIQSVQLLEDGFHQPLSWQDCSANLSLSSNHETTPVNTAHSIKVSERIGHESAQLVPLQRCDRVCPVNKLDGQITENMENNSDVKIKNQQQNEIESNHDSFHLNSSRLYFENNLTSDDYSSLSKRLNKSISEIGPLSDTEQVKTTNAVRYTNDQYPNLQTKKQKIYDSDICTLHSSISLKATKSLVGYKDKNIKHIRSSDRRLYFQHKRAEDEDDPVSMTPADNTLTSNVNQKMETRKWSRVLEIRPAPPEIGHLTLSPQVLITSPLRILEKRGNLGQNFKPTKLMRVILPLERGYWRIACSSWDKELRIRSWNCLGTYIEKDNSAGWGVSCMRDNNFDNFRVYCWGSIVGHIYLLLRIASEGKITNTGASWIDAEGEQVVIIDGTLV